MNGAHWHLVLNHLPIIIPMAGFILLILSFFVKNQEYSRAAYLLFVVGALATIPAFLTGEGAEETIEGIAGIDENFIHRHEEAAELLAICNYVLGFLSLVGIWASFYKQQFSHIIKYIVFLASLFVFFTGKQAGTTGGEIRHTEIRSGVSPVGGSGVEAQEDGDDD